MSVELAAHSGTDVNRGPVGYEPRPTRTGSERETWRSCEARCLLRYSRQTSQSIGENEKDLFEFTPMSAVLSNSLANYMRQWASLENSTHTPFLIKLERVWDAHTASGERISVIAAKT
ncbi:hypothetical protein RRG08_030024 [Elysia crispata]|uniref:Uncharacterized protein n=1 Tax=Elysia crispata TaxID=231223 RepID=A0AAE1CPK4_9GAST|nr:hypothetical protein RRG08_030024 [Elysia crispata]